jgi:hypothetical protein
MLGGKVEKSTCTVLLHITEILFRVLKRCALAQQFGLIMSQKETRFSITGGITLLS